jgi:hypothetical protein
MVETAGAEEMTLPEHMQRELDALGVRMPAKKPEPRKPPPDAGWSLRGEECPH